MKNKITTWFKNRFERTLTDLQKKIFFDIIM